MASSEHTLAHGDESSAGHHQIVSWRVYAAILVALLVLTAVTVAVAGVELGALNTPIAISIAVLKAALVMAFFMNVRNSSPLLRIVVAAGFIWFAIMIAFTMSDFISRDWIPNPNAPQYPATDGAGEAIPATRP